MDNAEWFVDWFNSPYYYLLYNNRNYLEANFFIDNLCAKLDLKSEAKIWDLACGKGRYSIALNDKGFEVVGTDLAQNSIFEASKCSKKGLNFYVHDMRHAFKINNFNAVFNLFTSIGYFKKIEDNYLVFKNINQALLENGFFVIDFFNSNKVIATLNHHYEVDRGGIIFNIKKKIKNKEIVKRIEFSVNKKKYYFEEQVSLLKQKDFESFANNTQLKLLNVYGNYQMEPFNEKISDRLILIFKKNKN